MPSVKHRAGGAWVAGGGPTHARIAGAWEAFAAGGTPTTYTIYATANGGRMYANDPAATTATGVFVNQYLLVGQHPATQVQESLLAFDTSGAAGTITSVTLHLWCLSNWSDGDFICEARAHDWGSGAMTAADWVARGTLGSKTLLATFDSASATEGAYLSFTSEAAFAGAINQAGETRIVLASDRFRNSITPTQYEELRLANVNEAGTSMDPKLVIEALV